MSNNATKKKSSSWKLFPQVDKQREQIATIDTTKENINAIEIPFGVRMANNSYTCPMLAIHLHIQKQFNNGRTLIDREILTDKKNEEAIFIGNRRLKEEAEAHAVEEEDIEIIPDSSNSYWKSTRKTAMVPYVEEGTDSMLSNRNVTRSPDEILVSENRVDGIFCRKKKKPNRVRKQTKITDHQIERTIIMVIEYNKHNYIGTLTNTQYLSTFGYVYNELTLQVSTGLVLPGTTDPQYQQFHFVPQNPRQYYQQKTPYQQTYNSVLTPRVVGTLPFLRQQ
ncbi:unnamed protein product [Adineta ricciae]|uniref:Uncharacterized protein n=1 Tax=Adineta ricciae TaxID=249248 RepID=A0A814H8W2_ADIRI|nr:unnamed protein product [Adineta ricciae]